MSERRFSEEEVAEILKQAAETEHTNRNLLRSGSGLTLAELNEIGREVGISPEAIRHAARRFDTTDATTQRLLGFPIGVGRTVELDRNLTDDEWDRLVVDLRETFNARGVIRQEGTLRSWMNGNLHVLLEPTAIGQRLRLRTLKGSAMGWLGGGAGMVVFAALLAIAGVVKGPPGDAGIFAAAVMLGVGGLGFLGIGSASIPGWARLRRKQMDQIAERAEEMTRDRSALPDIPSS
jgi:hypothetical protein